MLLRHCARHAGSRGQLFLNVASVVFSPRRGEQPLGIVPRHVSAARLVPATCQQREQRERLVVQTLEETLLPGAMTAGSSDVGDSEAVAEGERTRGCVRTQHCQALSRWVTRE